MDQDTWRFINTFAPWAAALGTFTAVYVSLHLARRSDRITLDVRVGLRWVGFVRSADIVGAPKEPALGFVWMNITNVGRRTASVNLIYWKPVPWRKRGIVFYPLKNEHSSDFPIELADGKSANYVFPLGTFREKNSELFRSEFSGPLGAIKLWLLLACVGTSIGDVSRTRPEKELRALIRKIATEKK